MGLNQSSRSAQFWVDRLQLEPHPEGGYYRQTYISQTRFAQACLPAGFGGSRAASTAIYFLLEKGDFSAFHRIQSDEVWHFYAGDALEVIILTKDGGLETISLGADVECGQVFQDTVPAGLWFASRLAREGTYALVGCTVSPGFDFQEFEMGSRDRLIAAYPQHATLIRQLTRK